MQLLWSRAGQARHCGCKACSQALEGVGRRATTKVARRYRSPTSFTDFFTACYTSVFASAAIVDAIRKEDRRKELDQQLDEARRDLDALRQSTDSPASTDEVPVHSISTRPEPSETSISRYLADMRQAGEATTAFDSHLEAHQNDHQARSVVRRGLAALQQSIEAADAVDEDIFDTKLFSINSQMGALHRTIKIICRTRPFMKEIKNPTDPAEHDASRLVRNLKHEYYGCPDAAYVNALGQIDYDALQQALMSEEAADIVQRPTGRILEGASHKTLGLVKSLLRSAYKAERGQEPCPTVDEVRDLLVTYNYPRYQVPLVELSHDTMASLHSCLRSIVGEEGVSAKEKVGRVCYNMLISPYPPDIHTFNTLIVAFDKAGLYHLSEEFVFSFLHRQFLKPTRLTFVAILNHYKEAGLVGRWHYAMSVLGGASTIRGPKLMQLHVDDVWQTPGGQSWMHNQNKRTVHGDYVTEHVPLHRGLTETVIHGFLHFKLFEAAVRFFTPHLKYGSAMSMRVIRHLLDGIVLALDWRAAIRLIRDLTSERWMLRVMLEGADADATAYIVGRMCVLLDMTGIYGPGRRASSATLADLNIDESRLDWLLTQLEFAGDFVKKATVSLPQLTASQTPEAISESSAPVVRYDPMPGSKSRLLQIEALWKEYVVVRNTIISLERKLTSVYPSDEFSEKISLHIGNAAVEKSLRIQEEFAAIVDGNERYKRKKLETETERRPWERKRGVGSYEVDVWVHALLKDHVITHLQPVEHRTRWLGRPYKPKALQWLSEWEKQQPGWTTVYPEGVRSAQSLPRGDMYWDSVPSVDEVNPKHYYNTVY